MTVRLRYLGEVDDPDDQAPIRQADAECFCAGDPPIKFAGVHWWVAGDLDHPMAYAGIRRSQRYSDCAYLARAGVRPEFRGHGLQKRLIRARVAWARRAGLSYVITDTSCSNAASANALIRCGFRVWDPPAAWVTPGALWLSKHL